MLGKLVDLFKTLRLHLKPRYRLISWRRCPNPSNPYEVVTTHVLVLERCWLGVCRIEAFRGSAEYWLNVTAQYEALGLKRRALRSCLVGVLAGQYDDLRSADGGARGGISEFENYFLHVRAVTKTKNNRATD